MPRRLPKTLKIPFIIVAVIAGIVLIISGIGAIFDRSAYHVILVDAEDALAYFSRFHYDDDGNAWEYYSEAAEKADSFGSDRELFRYLSGEIEITYNSMKTILNNLEIIELIREGAKQDYYSYPYEFEKGIAAEIPSYIGLLRAVDITCIKALYDMENGRNDTALENLFGAMMAGKHVASGPMVMDYMVGFSLVKRGLKVLRIGIASGAFNEEQLGGISEFLDDLEKHWPSLSEAIGAEAKRMRITFAGASAKDIGLTVFGGDQDADHFGFVQMFIVRLFCWRSFFSPYRSLHTCFVFMDEIFEELEKIESNAMDSLTDKIEDKTFVALQGKVDSFRKKNFFFNIAAPDYGRMLRKKMKEMMGIRLIHTSSLVAAYRLEKGDFPESIEELAKHLIVDLGTGKQWQYTNYADSVIILIPGLDDEDADDALSIILTGLGIKRYLDDKRNNFLENKKRQDK